MSAQILIASNSVKTKINSLHVATKENEIGRACKVHGGNEKCIQHFSRKSHDKRSLARFKPRWDDDIKMYF
jgi:hypothetical protein